MKKTLFVSGLALITMPLSAEEINKIVQQPEINAVTAQDVATTEIKVIDANSMYGTFVQPDNVDMGGVNTEPDVVVEQSSDVDAIENVTPQDVPQIVPVKNYEDTKPRNPETKFPRGLQLGIGVSPTSGLNGFIGYNNKNFDSFWAKRFGIRFDFATYSPIKNRLNRKINDALGDDGIEIDDNLKIDNIALTAKHMGAMVDFYPFGNTWFLGGWRLSGGYMTGKLDLDANIVGKNVGGGDIEFELDGHKYYYTGGEMHGTATLDWKYNGPYLGTGFDLGLFWGFKIYMDAGVVFAGQSAKIDLNVPFEDMNLKDENGNIVGDTTNPQYNQIMQDYETAKAAELHDAQKELDKYPYYPLVKIGFMYRF